MTRHLYLQIFMRSGDKQTLKELVIAIIDVVVAGCLIAAFLLGATMLVACSSTSRVVEDRERHVHTEQTTDSVAHVAKRDSVVNTNVSMGEWWQNITDKEHWHEIHDTTFVYVRADGTTDTRTIRNEKEKEVVHDTLWRDCWRDSVRTEFVAVRDSVKETHYKELVDSLRQELKDKKVVIKEMSWWDKLRQGVMGGILMAVLAGVVWLWMKVVRR